MSNGYMMQKTTPSRLLLSTPYKTSLRIQQSDWSKGKLVSGLPSLSVESVEMVRVFEPNALETDRSFVVPCSRPDTPRRPPRTLPPRHRPCSATDPSNRPEQGRSTHHGT